MRELTAEDFKKVKKNPFYDRLIKEVANMNGETPESVMKRCLSELCSMLLDEYGINVREKAKETAIEVNKVSISGEFMEKFSGMYYSRYTPSLIHFSSSSNGNRF